MNIARCPFCARCRTELAKKYCQSAYRIDRYDKYLFLVWPRVEAALGDRVKARLLFERGLDAHPMNTKIMNVRTSLGQGSGAGRTQISDLL